MTHPSIAESTVELATLDWLAELGWTIASGLDFTPGEPANERDSYAQVVLTARLRSALHRLNPTLPAIALDDAIRKLVRIDAPDLIARNRLAHRMLIDGIPVEFRRADGSIGGPQVRVFDFDRAGANEWLAVNQFTVVEDKHNRRPDIVLFVNGVPLVVIELKNPIDEDATIWSAFNQLQTYKQGIPALFATNAVLVISDGIAARIGALTAERERFMPWRTTDGADLAPPSLPQLQVLLQGVFEHRRFLELVRHFIVFEEGQGGAVEKKLAGYHQFHAVNTALHETLRAVAASKHQHHNGRGGEPGDRRVGVVWHTQGSGKSLTMAYYAGRVILAPAMENPTVVVLTDRNDLDEQLYGTFARCAELLRQAPVRADSRTDLRDKLRVDSGGVVFTTIQKFFPDPAGDRGPLSARRNVVVIADEAHRSQYDFIDGFARHMRDALPSASFIGFTGTPIEKADASTRAVFGDYISVYDIQRAVQDGATVPIYYEGRLAKLDLLEAERPHIDPNFEAATEGEEVDRKEKLKSKWAQLEAIVGTEKRVALVAQDLVAHFEARLSVMDGKGMVVCMSRRVAVALHDAIVALRPSWYTDDDASGAIKLIMTGSAADPLDWQSHIRSKARREDLAKRFRDPNDSLKLVLVRDMWLTGFDAPCLHTMYADKPMRSHGLMQAIARVNRVFRDKPGGLIVDYLGLADELRRALATYTEAGGTGTTALDQSQAVELMLEKYEQCCDIFHGFDWARWRTALSVQRLSMLAAAQDHVLALDDGKARLLRSVTDLSQAFALAVPHEQTLAIRDDVGFFQSVRSALAKDATHEGKTDEDLDHAIRQIVSRAVASDEVVDIFAAAGLKKPDIAILSDEFLAEVRDMPHKNLAVEMLRKLLLGEIKARGRRNVVQARSFAELLAQAMIRYQNRAIETAKVIEELIAMAKDLRAADKRGEAMGLTDDELAFYDALEVSDSAVKVLGDAQLRTIARDLVETIKRNVSIDWTLRESVQARLRVIVKRILRKYGYPPDKQEKATDTVLEQAALLSSHWAAP